MKQALLLPHEIVGSMISAGRLDLLVGGSDTRLHRSIRYIFW